jgi:hypothetical protein
VYFIFKRSDGYVGQMNSATRATAERELASLLPKFTFEIVHESRFWDEAFVTELENQRAESTYVLPN